MVFNGTYEFFKYVKQFENRWNIFHWTSHNRKVWKNSRLKKILSAELPRIGNAIINQANCIVPRYCRHELWGSRSRYRSWPGDLTIFTILFHSKSHDLLWNSRQFSKWHMKARKPYHFALTSRAERFVLITSSPVLRSLLQSAKR